MVDQVVVLLVGFILTSVVGGLLGSYFQTRTWRQRHTAELGEERHRQAIRTFEEMSTLLDRRLYRMKRVWWSVRRSIEQGTKAKELESVRNDYRQVLFDWNDNLNRLLALVQTYFGAGTRQMLEDSVFEEFVSIGRALDYGLLRLSSASDAAAPIPRVGHRLNELSHRVYQLNVRMLGLLDNDLLGRDAPTSSPELTDSHSRLEFGAHGPAVRAIQRSLALAGCAVTDDGVFGPDTYMAILSIQQEHGLKPDGAVGPDTRKLLANLSPEDASSQAEPGSASRLAEPADDAGSQFS